MGVVWKGPLRRTAGAALGVAVGAAMLPVGAAPAHAGNKDLVSVLTTVTGSTVNGLTTPVVDALWGDKKADKKAKDLFGNYDPKKDSGSLFTVTEEIGARDLWDDKDAAGRAITGQGVTVAVLDSGVSGVKGLDGPGKIVRGPDLSLEVNGDITDPDTFGHGTHMAGIIAAQDSGKVDTKTGRPDDGNAHRQLGVAPGAKLLALKLATTDGSTDVSQVIAALDWVVQHRNDNGMNVRVVNLSFGTGSLQPYQVDPLAAAAERAWHSGIVVVVSGGNAGRQANSLTNPAIDPYVIAVGASEPQNLTHGWTKEPSVSDFSSRGTAERHVDLVAPGRSIVALRDPGSFVDTEHPEGRVDGDDSQRLFRGSGTSQAAAVVSGAAALMLQAYPQLTPDQLKAALVTTATPLRHAAPVDAGAGQLDLEAAAEAVEKAYEAKAPYKALLTARQTFPVATGAGSLEEARGGVHLADPESGDVLTGEVDVQGVAWTAGAKEAWHGGVWRRARWSGDNWTSSGWARARWSGSAWTSARWGDNGWERARWSRARWSDASWERARWSGTGWS